MFTDKKGSGYLLTAVLFVIIVLVVGMFVSNLWNWMWLLFTEDHCGREVRLHAKSLEISGATKKIPFGSSLSEEISSSIDCPTKFETVSGDEDRIKRELANGMVNCWENWGEGELELFAQEEGNFCHVCSVYEFEESSRIRGMETYLKEKGYLAKLLPYSSTNTDAIEDNIRDYNGDVQVIDTSKDWAVVFKYVKGRDAIIKEIGSEDARLATAFAAGVGGFWAGAKTGAMICHMTGPGILPCSIGGGLIGGAVGGITNSVGIYSMISGETQVFAHTTLAPYTGEGLQNLGCEVAPARQ